VATFTDLAMASGQPRPGLQAALDYLEHHQVGVLVVYRGDRLTRKTTEVTALVEQLKSRGVSVHIVAESPSNS
jgi:DNA invertase Pin-like site-specific DNA recombinase